MKKKILGIVLCILIGAIATFLSGLRIGNFSIEIIGAPVLSILFGMFISLIFPKFINHEIFKYGIKFTSKKFCNGLLFY